MKTLVLNVDRDDDFGRKAKVKSPIIGINDNLEAAHKLGQSDPEDSDLNAIYYAISIYNKLKKEKKDVEIATICGNISVGIKSDEILSNQLEVVIKQSNATDVVLISDGAEDDYILPIIQSRLKITAVERVAVKQSRELEDTYYRFIKILEDEKVLKQFVLPIALVLIVWAFFVIFDMAASGFGAILLTLGVYLLVRCFKWEKNIAFMWEEIKSGFLTGKLSIWAYFIAILIIIVNAFFAYNSTIDQNFASDSNFIPTFFFLYNMVWGIVIGGAIAIFGRVVDVYVRDKKSAWVYWIAPFSLFAFGFISSALFEALYKSLYNWPENFDINPFLTVKFIFYSATGILIALIGAITYHYIREIHSIDEKENQIEKETKNIAEES